MGWLDNLARVVRSQLNSWVQEAEDPEKVLEQVVSEMEREVIQLRTGLAEAIATQKRTERQIYQQQKLAQDWHDKAALAVSQGQDLLAKEALGKWQTYRTNIAPFQEQLAQQRQLITKLKDNLRHLEQKFSQAKAQKDLYLARLRSAAASQKLQELSGNLSSGSTAEIFERLESKILAMETNAELIGEGIEPLEKQFRSLEGEETVEAELAKLKAEDPQLRKLRSELEEI